MVELDVHVSISLHLTMNCSFSPFAAITVTEQATTRTSALWAARRGEHDEVVRLLVAAGAQEQADIIHETPPSPSHA